MKKVILLVALLLTTSLTFAQNKTNTKAPISQQENNQDKQFVVKAIQGGNAEIKKGMLARKKSTNAEIVRYGEMMEKDHHAVNNKLKETAQQKGYKISEQLSNDLQQSYNQLEKLDGSAFDKAYVSQMVNDHKKTIELFQQQANSGIDQDLKDIAISALPTLEKHLKQIVQLEQEIHNP